MLADALLELADIASCIEGDFHTMHLNVRGAGFDRAHAFLKTYYEEAAEDYDRWAEAALMSCDAVPSKNGSSTRISWQAVEGKALTYADVVARTDVLLDAYLIALDALLRACDDEPGIANTLQTRLEYWSKERLFFNRRR